MKQVDEMPTSGQLVAVWVCNGEIYSSPYKWKSNNIFVYSGFDDCWGIISDISWMKAGLDRHNAKYFIAE